MMGLLITKALSVYSNQFVLVMGEAYNCSSEAPQEKCGSRPLPYSSSMCFRSMSEQRKPIVGLL